MNTRLYVGNLPRGANEALLRMAFGQDMRTVKVVTIGTDSKTGRLESFGIVDMATKEDAQAAIKAWHGKDLDGRALTVNETRPRAGRRPRKWRPRSPRQPRAAPADQPPGQAREQAGGLPLTFGEC